MACDKATRRANQRYQLRPVPARDEGRFAIVTNARAGCGGRGRLMQDERGLVADGEVVWSWRPDAGAKFVRSKLLTGDGGKKPGHRGEHEGNRKTIAQGKPDCLRWTCMLVCAFFRTDRTRDRGCRAHPAFPAPSTFGEGETTANLGRRMPRECGIISSRCLKTESETSSASSRPGARLRTGRRDP